MTHEGHIPDGRRVVHLHRDTLSVRRYQFSGLSYQFSSCQLHSSARYEEAPPMSDDSMGFHFHHACLGLGMVVIGQVRQIMCQQ
jgi:hypothetical protein